MSSTNKNHWAIKGIDPVIRKEITEKSKNMDISIGDYISNYIYPAFKNKTSTPENNNSEYDKRLSKLESILERLENDSMMMNRLNLDDDSTECDIIKILANSLAIIAESKR